MLTPLTQTAIALLYDISNGGNLCRLQEYSSCQQELPTLLFKLERAGLISLKEGCIPGLMDSYRLSRPGYEISLLDILESIGEHLNCNHPTREEMYSCYRRAANKLGVINHITRIYLSDIRLVDL
jgi:hypothetical protein